MNLKTLILTILGLVCLVGTTDAKPFEYYQNNDPVSYAEVDLSKKSASTKSPTGTSSVKNMKLTSTKGATYSAVHQGCVLDNRAGLGLGFSLYVSTPGMIQLAMDLATPQKGTETKSQYMITVNGVALTATPITDSVSSYHQILFQIPESKIKANTTNTFGIHLTSNSGSDLVVSNVKFLPQKITASKGKLTTTLYTQFGETGIINGATYSVGTGKNKKTYPLDSIWTRAYGLSERAEMIPGPTLYYKPGDLVSVKIKNLLNPKDNEVLAKYDTIASIVNNGDEILANDTLKGELNVPHNLNNTNLHVHGLHVDPSKDDVTIVIVPEGESTAEYDAPHTHAPVSQIADLNEYSVADQSVKAGKWNYQYKIPPDHLPGTHWFHPHKHGATSAQVENGLAGTMVIQEDATNALVPYPKQPKVWIQRTAHNRLMT